MRSIQIGRRVHIIQKTEIFIQNISRKDSGGSAVGSEVIFRSWLPSRWEGESPWE